MCSESGFFERSYVEDALFFHLVLEADAKGFFASAVKTIRMIDASQDDLAELIKQGFIIRFPSGVCCIRHWNMMNSLKQSQAKSDFPEAKYVRLDGGVYVLRDEEEEEWT